MDGESNGKPYSLMGWFRGENPTIFGFTPKYLGQKIATIPKPGSDQGSKLSRPGPPTVPNLVAMKFCPGKHHTYQPFKDTIILYCNIGSMYGVHLIPTTNLQKSIKCNRLIWILWDYNPSNTTDILYTRYYGSLTNPKIRPIFGCEKSQPRSMQRKNSFPQPFSAGDWTLGTLHQTSRRRHVLIKNGMFRTITRKHT